MATARHHIERVLRVVADPADEHAADGSERGLIARSWRRCAQRHGLDPGGQAVIQVESAERVRESRDRGGAWMRTARAGMEKLFAHVADLGYVAMLTDPDGVTVDYLGDSAPGSLFRRIGLAPGANWSERFAGTNGIGTCIADRRPLTCHRDDHFFPDTIGLSCTTTPLFDPHGGLLGALDVSAVMAPDARESQHMVRHLVQLYGGMIEEANFLQAFGDRWILRLGAAPALVEITGELLLAVDDDGVVVGANRPARARLRTLAGAGTGSDTPVGGHLSGIFRTPAATLMGHLRNREQLRVATWDGADYWGAVLAPRLAAPSRTATRVVAEVSASGSGLPEPLALLAGDDAQMARVLAQAARLADASLPVLVQGETGTGKEVLARALHDSGRRAQAPFVAVNCASIPESLIESELFGYTAGTFTGARSRGMTGLVQRADGGTLFLDEIGDMPLALQTRLLRVLAEGEVLPLGADRPVRVDVKVVSASHRDLRELVAAGSFREDLYFRLGGATLALPPLRARRDFDRLVDRQLAQECEAAERHVTLDAAARAELARRPWPGNLRELRNALRFALTMCDGGCIGIEHLPPAPEAGALPAIPAPQPPAAEPGVRADEPVAAAQPEADPRARLHAALRRHRWNVSAAARELGLCRATVYRRMQRFGIVSPVDQVH